MMRIPIKQWGYEIQRRVQSKRWSRGQSIVIVAAAFPVIVLVSVMVFDFARVHMVQQEVQNAVDAAALAGASQAQKEVVYRCLQVTQPNPKGANKPPVVYTQSVKWSYFYKLNPTAASNAAQATLDANLKQMGLYDSQTGQYPDTCASGHCQFDGQSLALQYAWPFYNTNGVTPVAVADTTAGTSPGLLDPTSFPPGDRTTQVPAATGFEVQASIAYHTMLLSLVSQADKVLYVVRHSVSQLYYNANAATNHPALPSDGTWISQPTTNPQACP